MLCTLECVTSHTAAYNQLVTNHLTKAAGMVQATTLRYIATHNTYIVTKGREGRIAPFHQLQLSEDSGYIL